MSSLPDSLAASAPRVVLDTNVALALFAYADPTCAALARALRERRLQAHANAATRTEWLCVLARDRLGLDTDTRQCAQRAFDSLVITVDASPVTPMRLPRCRDPDDQVFLEIARDLECVALLTRDRQLLKLSKQTARSCGFRVCRPEEYP